MAFVQHFLLPNSGITEATRWQLVIFIVMLLK